MSRFGRIRRRPDHWASQHERARARAAERLDGPLGLAEATWLDEHLASCRSCAAIAAAYESDRQALQVLRANPPEPPRDLWARTAAAIEQESAARGRHVPTSVPSGRRFPLGALSGIAVIAVVVGVSAVSTGLFSSGASVTPLSAVGSAIPGDAQRQSGESAVSGNDTAGGAAPTPIAVGPGEVQWIRTGTDGTFAFNAAMIDEVCPADGQDGCATLEGAASRRLALVATPESIIGSPTNDQAVVFTRDAAGDQEVVVVDLPREAVAVASSAPAVTADPYPTPAATAGPTTAPASTAASPIPEPTPTDIDTAGATDPPTPSPSPSTTPSASAETSTPTSPTASASPTPTVSPEPTVAASLAIANDVEIVGQSAAFSADGRWFAFTAR
ncbi:MAG: zf-HC2 domain-containing protein, partial [Candidatus Limnocylindrales bacterium]